MLITAGRSRGRRTGGRRPVDRRAAWRCATWTVVALVLCLARPAAAQPCPTPTHATITLDGTFGDWVEVLANPTNTSRDGDGSTIACGSSTDLDCPVSGSGSDLVRFAWTSDDENVYLYHERLGRSAGAQSAVYYVDRGHDGVMGAGDIVVVVPLDGVATSITGRVLGYVPDDPGGDPMTSPGGASDGWTMPGSSRDTGLGGQVDAVSDQADGLKFEVRISWNSLRCSVGSPLTIHVSQAIGSVLPDDVEDNLGSETGAVDTAERGVSIAPERVIGAPVLATALLEHVVVNEGNVAELISLKVAASAGHDLTLRADRDMDGFAETTLAFDSGGDGVLTDPLDVLAAAGDSDGDGALDLGVLAAGASVGLEVAVSIPGDAAGVTEEVDIRVAGSGNPACGGSVLDLLRIGDYTLVRNEWKLGVPGQSTWIPHAVQNNTSTTAVINFSTVSVSGWPCAYFNDPNADGDPSDAIAMTDGDGDGMPDVSVAPGAGASLLVEAAVPSSAPFATETIFVRAHVDGPPVTSAVDSVSLGNELVLAPSFLLADGNARYGASGRPVYFGHRLTNYGSAHSSFDLSATSDLGWPITLLTDPDGDGRPYDSQPLAPGPIGVAFNGGVFRFIVRVDVPGAALHGDTSRLSVEARFSALPAITARAEDDAIVAIVRVHDDPARVVTVSTLAPCSTVYCAASGLPPDAADYRFTWRDASGTVVRLTSFTTSSAGEGSDELVLGPGDEGAGWTVAIEHLELAAWVPLDVARYRIGDGLRSTGLAVPEPMIDISTTSLTASLGVTNDSVDSAVAAQSLRWVVLTPDGLEVLLPDGTWAAWTGAEATRVDLPDLAPGESRSLVLDAAGITFPVDGAYSVIVYRSSACGTAERLFAERVVLVVDDTDDDGVKDVVEIAAGTDRLDADSDDDGLADGADGLGDSDGDTVIDALDCDSDNDGLPDGLEAGIWAAGPGTDPASSCFAPDQDPTTTTDPDSADSDGGGVSDGAEDVNHDGARDPGERDPSAAGDDGCSLLRPGAIAELRLTRLAGGALLTWTPVVDDCVTYVVRDSTALPAMSDAFVGLTTPALADDRAMSGESLRFYLVVAESSVSGRGPEGI